jgi:hypothetical protein
VACFTKSDFFYIVEAALVFHYIPRVLNFILNF